ncbi:hypothetical protein E2C01_010803 [Portunus trituberculatus]|uniref:Uncharacterized protein n=1 Tax=Portunus trituberculatus TaxID=210409 RepID=A0A5B7D9Q1_PORTR|nr:hypothetical protein [Portunus trituberculatus]
MRVRPARVVGCAAPRLLAGTPGQVESARRPGLCHWDLKPAGSLPRHTSHSCPGPIVIRLSSRPLSPPGAVTGRRHGQGGGVKASGLPRRLLAVAAEKASGIITLPEVLRGGLAWRGCPTCLGSGVIGEGGDGDTHARPPALTGGADGGEQRGLQ